MSAKKNSFFGGAAILAAGIMIVKVISAFYKIPIVNILDDGYQDFTNAYNVYNILLVISTAGLPVAVSKMVSEANTLGRQNQVHKIFRVALAVFLCLGLVSFGVMFFGADWLAGLMHDEKAVYSIRALAPAVISVGCLSAFRGYAQGHSNMTPTAVSQILEAIIKLVFGLALALWLVHLGFNTSIAAAGAICGVTLGTVLALVYMIVDYVRTRRSEPAGAADRPPASSALLKRLLHLAVPITLTSSFMAIITTVDNSLVQARLQNAVGLSLDECRTLMTNYSGVQNVYQLPASLMVAITASVIPAVSACYARHDRQGASRIVGSALKTTALLAFPSGIGMIVLGEPLSRLFFSGSRSMTPETSGLILSILGVASIFVCLMMAANAILQSNGVLNLPVVTMLIGGVIMVFFDYFVVAVPSINIIGSPVGTCVCYGITACLDLAIIKRVLPACPSFAGVFLRPLLASLLMGAAAWGFYEITAGPLGNNIATLLAVAVGGGVYLVLVVALKAISKEDLALMPKGNKLARILRIR